MISRGVSKNFSGGVDPNLDSENARLFYSEARISLEIRAKGGNMRCYHCTKKNYMSDCST